MESLKEAGAEIGEIVEEKEPEVKEGLTDKIVRIAKSTQIEKREREKKIGELVEDKLMKQYGSVYSDLLVDLDVPPRRPKDAKLAFGGLVELETPEWYIRMPLSTS